MKTYICIHVAVRMKNCDCDFSLILLFISYCRMATYIYVFICFIPIYTMYVDQTFLIYETLYQLCLALLPTSPRRAAPHLHSMKLADTPETPTSQLSHSAIHLHGWWRTYVDRMVVHLWDTDQPTLPSSQSSKPCTRIVTNVCRPYGGPRMRHRPANSAIQQSIYTAGDERM